MTNDSHHRVLFDIADRTMDQAEFEQIAEWLAVGEATAAQEYLLQRIDDLFRSGHLSEDNAGVFYRNIGMSPDHAARLRQLRNARQRDYFNAPQQFAVQ